MEEYLCMHHWRNHSLSSSKVVLGNAFESAHNLEINLNNWRHTSMCYACPFIFCTCAHTHSIPRSWNMIIFKEKILIRMLRNAPYALELLARWGCVLLSHYSSKEAMVVHITSYFSDHVSKPPPPFLHVFSPSRGHFDISSLYLQFILEHFSTKQPHKWGYNLWESPVICWNKEELL